MLRQPHLGRFILMGVKLVQNDTEVLLGIRGDDLVQGVEEVGRSAALLDPCENLTGLDFRAGQDGAGAVPNIFIGPGARLLRP